MTLTKEWFMQGKEREAQRNEKGVKLEDAIEDLRTARSPLSPYAWEMADWIYRNWPLEKFLQLPVPEREIVMRFVDKNYSYPGVKAARQKRRLEDKARDLAEKEARKNQPVEDEDFEEDANFEEEENPEAAASSPHKVLKPIAKPAPASLPIFPTQKAPHRLHIGRSYTQSKPESLPPDDKQNDIDPLDIPNFIRKRREQDSN